MPDTVLFWIKNTISITKSDGTKENIETDKVIIATGSKPITPASFNYDKKRVITSTEALNISKIPKKNGRHRRRCDRLRTGFCYARLGTEVEVVEFLDRIITGMDKDCGKELQRSLKKLGIKFHLGHAVTSVKGTTRGVTVVAKSKKTEEEITLKADYCLIAIGRRLTRIIWDWKISASKKTKKVE